jgi:c-di-GMP-binding flagellar brake protein YcgR
MVTSNNDERRKDSRVGFKTIVRILFEADEKEVNFEGNSRDLSLKGMLISSENMFSSGTKCSIKIYLTGGIDKIELRMKGTVIRSGDNGSMGITFDSMDIDTYSHLKNIVYYNTRDDSA